MMRNVFVALALVVAGTALAKPIEVDLTAERTEYEAKARPRAAGITFLSAGIATAIGGAIGLGVSGGMHAQLLAQQVPIDVGQRQMLISSGEIANGMGLTAVLLGIGLAAVSIYFFAVSF